MLKPNPQLLQFWGLFASILLIFLLYSSLQSPIKWDFELKQADSKRIFKQNQPQPAQILPVGADSNQATAQTQPNNGSTATANPAILVENSPPVTDFPKDAFRQYDIKPITDSSSLYILLAGDSMTEELRFGLGDYCKKNGFKLFTCTWYSSNTEIWSEKNRLAELINEYKPDLILFTLGSNELFRKDIAEREQFIQDIIYEADRSRTPFVWLNPPAWKDDTGISELIKKNVGQGRHFDSRGVKMARKSDGAHPTREGAKVWADTIVRYLKQDCFYKPLFAHFSLDLNQPAKPYRANQLDNSLPARQNKAEVRVLKEQEASPIVAANPSAADSNQIASKPAAKPAQDSQKTNPKPQPKDSSQSAPKPSPKDSSKPADSSLPNKQ